MATHALSAEEFLVGWCERCAAEVLTHLTAADDEPQRPLCVRCDAPVTNGLRVAGSDELEEQGYAVYEEGGGGCGSGGCGSGSCGRA